MLNLREVHKYERIKGSLAVRLVQVNPVVRLKSGRNEPPLFIQGGKVYAEGGDEITDLPEWFWPEARKLTPAARQECGLVLPMEKAASAPIRSRTKPSANTSPAKAEEGPRKIWKCDLDNCGAVIETRKKGVHIAMHRRKVINGNDQPAT